MATGPTTVNISWSPPLTGSNCVDHYNITINSNGINQYTTTNITSVIVKDLTVGMNYSFIVKVIEKGGGEGENSETIDIILEGLSVLTHDCIIIMYCIVPEIVSSLTSSIECACSLNVSWEVSFIIHVDVHT